MLRVQVLKAGRRGLFGVQSLGKGAASRFASALAALAKMRPDISGHAPSSAFNKQDGRNKRHSTNREAGRQADRHVISECVYLYNIHTYICILLFLFMYNIYIYI